MADILPEDDPNGDGMEPSATSAPPAGIELPEETPYGSNRPLEQIPDAPATREPGGNHSVENDVAPAEAAGGKSFRISLFVFAPLLAGLLGGAFYLGTLQKKERVITKEAEASKPAGKKGSNTNFGPDRGIYRGENDVDSAYMIGARIELAKKQIFVVTGDPGNENLLNELVRKKNETGIPIVIITGGETTREQLRKAKEYNLQVYKIKSDLERPYMLLIIDNRFILDAGREKWFWETSNGEAVKTATEWATKLIEGAEIQ